MEEEDERRKLGAMSTSVSVPAWAARLLQPQEGNHGRYAPVSTGVVMEVEENVNAEANAKTKTSNEDEIQLDDADDAIDNRRHGEVLRLTSNGVVPGHDDQPMAFQPSSFQKLTDMILMTFTPGDLDPDSLVNLQASCDALSRREFPIARVTSREKLTDAPRGS